MEDYQLRHDIDRLRRFLDELEILYKNIVKIGEDVILINRKKKITNVGRQV